MRACVYEYVLSQNHSYCMYPVKFMQLCLSPHPAVQSDRQPCVSQGILWYLRGLISKLLEVGFDLELKALITLFPLASLGAAFLPISEWRDQILDGADELEVFQCFIFVSPFLSQPCKDLPIYKPPPALFEGRHIAPDLSHSSLLYLTFRAVYVLASV